MTAENRNVGGGQPPQRPNGRRAEPAGVDAALGRAVDPTIASDALLVLGDDAQRFGLGGVDAALPIPPADPAAASRASRTGDRAAAAGRPRETLVIAHRGDSLAHPENTLVAVKSALDKGAQGLEIDICMTADGRIILWHDEVGDGFVPKIRSLGWEKGQNYRPVNPPDGHHIHEMTLAEVRATCGYDDMRTWRRVPVEIPTLEAFFALVKDDPRLQRVDLDVKMPPGNAGVHHAFGRELERQLAEAGLGDKVNVLVDDPRTLTNLKAVMGPHHRFSSDRNVSPLMDVVGPGDVEGLVRDAVRQGNGVVSFGKPVAGKLFGVVGDALDLVSGAFGRGPASRSAFDEYLGRMGQARREIDRSGEDIRLVAWTINDPDQMADLLAVPVDEILTDRPELLCAVKAQVAAGTYVYERPRHRRVANAISGIVDVFAWAAGGCFTILRKGLGEVGLGKLGYELERLAFTGLGWVTRGPVRWAAERIDDVFSGARRLLGG